MLYVSQILNRPVFDARNEKIAVIKDVLVRYGDEEYPPVIGLVARYRRRNFFMPSRDFKDLGLYGATMTSTILDLTPFIRREGEVLLGKDVLDNQLIDVDGNEYALGEEGDPIALCRCGASTTKPFCDKTHSKIGFEAAERAVAPQG